MARGARPFNARALQRYAVAAIRPRLGPETLVRRYAVLVPVEEIKAGELPRRIATVADLENLQLMLIKHFRRRHRVRYGAESDRCRRPRPPEAEADARTEQACVLHGLRRRRQGL